MSGILPGPGHRKVNKRWSPYGAKILERITNNSQVNIVEHNIVEHVKSEMKKMSKVK